jgi:hypothetical protein
MTPSNKIRFVHGNHDFSGPRFTIAYHRDASYLLFAFTNLYHTDEYVKSEGRTVSGNRLLQAFESDFLFDDTAAIYNDGVEVGFFSEKQKVGGLRIEAFHGDLTSILASHFTEGMTLMDLKHSYVSEQLFKFVNGYNNASTY